jgi:SAM-dependent methyltransferase
LIVYGAANISFPPMGVAVAFGAIQLGERVIYGHWMQERYSVFKTRSMTAVAKEFFVAWTAGGLMLGTAIGLAAGGLIYLLLKLRARRASAPPTEAPGRATNAEIETAIGRAARRYIARSGPWVSCYVVMKYGLDPCYEEILQRVPPGARVTDLGSGLGMLPLALAFLGGDRRCAGIEWDPRKARAGARVARGLPAVSLAAGDVRVAAIPPGDIITLVDLLHYFDNDTQRALLARAAAALPPGGRLLIREHDHADSFRSRWTRHIEKQSMRFGWNRSAGLHFRPISELVCELETLGLAVEQRPVSGPLHPGNVLLIAVKP